MVQVGQHIKKIIPQCTLKEFDGTEDKFVGYEVYLDLESTKNRNLYRYG
jgi:hypothetical protein